MLRFKIYITGPMRNEIGSLLDKEEIMKFNKFKEKLRINPYIGKPLRVPFVREFKTNSGKRLYFIIYEDNYKILFVATSKKKDQKNTINSIFKNLKEYRQIISNID